MRHRSFCRVHYDHVSRAWKGVTRRYVVVEPRCRVSKHTKYLLHMSSSRDEPSLHTLTVAQRLSRLLCDGWKYGITASFYSLEAVAIHYDIISMMDRGSFTYTPFLLIASSSRVFSLKATVSSPKSGHINGDHSALGQLWAATSSAVPPFAASVILGDVQPRYLLLVDEGKISPS